MVLLDHNSPQTDYEFPNGQQLHAYQKAELNAMYKMENTMFCPQENTERVVRTKFGLYTTCEGSGKTRTLLALVKSMFNPNEERDLDEETNAACLYSTDVIMVGVKNENAGYVGRTRATLVIVPNHLFNHWKNECFSLGVTFSTSELADDDEVLLVPVKSLKNIIDKYDRWFFERIIVDQAEIVHIKDDVPIKTRFTWFVSSNISTLYHLPKYRQKWKFFAKYLKVLDVPWANKNDFTLETCRDVIDELKESWVTIHRQHYICKCPRSADRHRRDVIGSLVQEGCYEEAYKTMGLPIQRLGNMPQAIYRKSAEPDACVICYEAPRSVVGMQCCSNVFCVGCIVRWFNTKKTCPICRNVISNTSRPVMYLEDQKYEQIETFVPTRVFTKLDAILQIINNNPDGRFVIFNLWDYTFYEVADMLWDNNIPNRILKGSIESISKYHQRGAIKVLLTSNYFVGPGMHFPWVTDVIFYNKTDQSIDRSLINKIVFPSRQRPLRIHYLDKYITE